MTDVRDRLQAALGDAYTVGRELEGGERTRAFFATELAPNRPVVVKVVLPEHGGELFADRFAREVKFASRLQHTNIVPLLAAGAVGELAYYTTPFVDGPSLRTRLAGEARIPLDEATHILRDVAVALDYAHDLGVVHRDLRPENIFLSSGTALVTDFGVAKAMTASRTLEISTESEAASSGTLTSAGSAIGTPAYMSPEQAAGSVADPRSDLYAWGTIAYELLAGVHPFAERSTAHAMVEAQLTERPVPIAERNPSVPAPLARIVMQCLEKDADDRPDTASELLAGIDGTPPPPPPSPEVVKRRTSREVRVIDEEEVEAHEVSDSISRRMGVAAALLIVALLLWGWFSRQAS